jgi:hypothetical protein
MNALRAILDRLNDVEATIAQVERTAVAQRSLATRLSLRSLESRRDLLHEEMAEITRSDQVEICDYRIIPESRDAYAIAAVTSVLRDFQELVTLVFDALSRPKPRAKVSPDIQQKTQFDFGFAYAGSLGVVMTIQNDRLLVDESDLDRAVGAVFDLLKIRSKEEVRETAHRYGVPAVRKLHHWTKTHSQYGMSADIKWVRDASPRREVLAQPLEMAEVVRAIEERSEPISESIVLTGNLVAWNVPQQTFAMEFVEEGFIAGRWAEDFDGKTPLLVVGRYRARLTKETVMKYAEDKEEVRWYLNGLENV